MVTALGLYLTMATTHAQAGLLIVDHVPHMPGAGEPLIGREEIVGKGLLVDP